jgi:hypothetical protein
MFSLLRISWGVVCIAAGLRFAGAFRGAAMRYFAGTAAQIISVASLLLWGVAVGEEYRVEFQEGAYAYDPHLSARSPENKYLASVKVYRVRDNKLLAVVRGSTLPDSSYFYSDWHQMGTPLPPTDADVARMIAIIDKRIAELKNDIKKQDDLFKRVSVHHQAFFRDLVSIPVVWSGEYRFRTGRHKADECYEPDGRRRKTDDRYCPHGHPFVPRLLGGDLGDPYRARESGQTGRKDIYPGGYIETVNPNRAQGDKRVAAGINIHDGRGDELNTYKDSDGCLTIHKDHWTTFYEALRSAQPNLPVDEVPDAWGTVVVRRDGGAVPKSPENVSVQ